MSKIPYLKYTDAAEFQHGIPAYSQYKVPKGWKYSPTHQFTVPKVNSTILRKYGFNLETTYEELVESGCIIALADNQLLSTLRRVTNHPYTPEKYVAAKKTGNLKTYQFIPEYLTVVVDSTPDYFRMKSNHQISEGYEYFGKFQSITLTIDGVKRKYTRLSCSPAQARKNIVIFCDEEYTRKVQDILDCGRNIHAKMAGTKFNAYFGLYSSASQPVTMPRIAVVGSYESSEPVRMMYEQPPHEGETEKEFFNRDSDLLEIEEDLPFCRFDGGGLIRPEMAMCWAHDLNLDYCPSDFCIRFTYTKGAVVTFDWIEWCNEFNGGNYIVKDYFGDDVDLSQVDIIITPDMAKMIGQWDSVAHYMDESKKAGVEMRVTKYARKTDKTVNTLNYQYIQSLNWDEGFPYNWEYLVKTHGYNKACELTGISDDVHKMTEPTTQHFNDIINNPNKRELFLMNGDFEETIRGSDWFVKSGLLCPALFEERYAKDRITNAIKGAIQDAKLGKGIEHGNYQCLIPDPFAHIQYITGHEVTGILQDGEYFSNYWRDTQNFCLARSPQTYRSEWVRCKNTVNELTDKWFMHLYSGIVCPAHGHYTMNLAGSDFDYDIGFTTDNPIIYNKIYGDDKLVTGYDVPKPAKEELIDHKDEKLAICDSFSFGQKIGQITNLSTSLYCMQTRFNEGTPEYDLIESRLMQLCIAQSKQIDKTKLGRKVKEIPSCWVKETGDPVSDAVIVTKKPYFMSYRYDALHKDYSNWSKKWSDEPWSAYYEDGETTDNIIKALDLCPVMLDPCAMNRWAWYIEKEAKTPSKQKERDFNPSILIPPGAEFDYNIYSRVKAVINKFRLVPGMGDENNKSPQYQLLKKKLIEIAGDNLPVYMVRLFFYDEKSRSKGLFWEIVGEEIFYHLLINKTDKAYILVEDDKGEVDYLFKKYSRMEFSKEEILHKLY